MDEQAARHGFLRVATPTFESLDLFTAKSGDAVVGELYAFEDKGGRPLTLRPELTAPVMRMVANEMRSVPKPMRLAYYGSCFRYEEFKTASLPRILGTAVKSSGLRALWLRLKWWPLPSP